MMTQAPGHLTLSKSASKFPLNGCHSFTYIHTSNHTCLSRQCQEDNTACHAETTKCTVYRNHHTIELEAQSEIANLRQCYVNFFH